MTRMRLHRRDDPQYDERDSDHQVSHLSHLLLRRPSPATISTALHVPVRVQSPRTSD